MSSIQRIGHVLEDGPHLPLIHWMEPFHEFFDGSATLKVLEQGGYRKPSVGEDPGSTEPVGYTFHRRARLPVHHTATSLCIDSVSVASSAYSAFGTLTYHGGTHPHFLAGFSRLR